ncbi:MAG: type IX secretion system membrane protein PorP/SprF [Flavobacteriales bacterium]|nr:type IX secretion system membrane protein PorP/SprF [Flavobacteriales bacterium]
MIVRLIHITLFICVVSVGYSQQEETYTQYIFNHYAQNPAYGGTKSCPDIKFGTRAQWVGFGGGPVTSFFSYNTAIGYKDQTSKSWHGIGTYIVDDRTGTANGAHGFYKSTSFYLSYAFHVRLSHRIVASAGLFVGAREFSSGVGSSRDPLLSPTSRIIAPDIGAGILVYHPDWFLSLAIKQIFTYTVKSTSATGATDNLFQYRARQYYFTYAKWIEADDLLFSYTPSFNIKYQESVLPSVDLSVMFHYMDNKFNLGASYRIGDGIAALLQFNLLSKLSVGYAYEYPFNKMNKGTRQTHEIILKWDPCWSNNSHFGSVNCPSF